MRHLPWVAVLTLAWAPAPRCPSYVCVAFSPNGKLLATAGCGLPVKLSDAATGAEHQRLAEGSAWASPAQFTPDGKHVLAAKKSTLMLLPVAGGAESEFPDAILGLVPTVALSRDGKTLAASGEGGTVIVWDLASRKERRRFEGFENLWSLSLDEKSKRLAVAAKNVQVRDLSKGDSLLNWKTNKQHYAAGLSPDGRTLAAGSESGDVTLWDVDTGKELRRLAHAGSILSVAFSSDGTRMASGSWGGDVHLWEVSTGKRLFRLAGGGSTLAFSPDGKLLASGGPYDKPTVFVWDTATGAEKFRLDPR